MYLSRIKLDTKKRETMIALSNPQKIHGAIESALGIEQAFKQNNHGKQMAFQADGKSDKMPQNTG